jgi:hypothetical protein
VELEVSDPFGRPEGRPFPIPVGKAIYDRAEKGFAWRDLTDGHVEFAKTPPFDNK